MSPIPNTSTQRVTRPDVDLAAHTFGPPIAEARGVVLLIHGGIHDHMHATRFWCTPGVASALATRVYRVLAPDRRNTPGDTRTTFATHTWPAEAADMAAILDTLLLPHTRVHLIAASNGCSAAIHLALRIPQRTASLILGWPAAPDLEPMHTDFTRTAAAIELLPDTASWLTHLHTQGVPRPGDDRPGYPFGTALVHDPRLAASFAATTPATAANIIRASAAALIPALDSGSPLRGLTSADLATLAASGIPTAILPSLPDDRWHPPATLAALHATLPNATLLPHSAPPPHPTFPDHHATCVTTLRTWLDQHPA